MLNSGLKTVISDVIAQRAQKGGGLDSGLKKKKERYWNHTSFFVWFLYRSFSGVWFSGYKYSSRLLYFSRIDRIFSVGVSTFVRDTSWFMKSMMEARNLLMSASM